MSHYFNKRSLGVAKSSQQIKRHGIVRVPCRGRLLEKSCPLSFFLFFFFFFFFFFAEFLTHVSQYFNKRSLGVAKSSQEIKRHGSIRVPCRGHLLEKSCPLFFFFFFLP